VVASHLLILPEVCLDGDGDSIVLQLAGVQELLQELPLPPSLLCQGGRHLWRTLHSYLAMYIEVGEVQFTGAIQGYPRLYKPNILSHESIYLEGHEGDKVGKASWGHVSHILLLVTHPAQHRHQQQHHIAQCIQTNRFQNAFRKMSRFGHKNISQEWFWLQGFKFWVALSAQRLQHVLQCVRHNGICSKPGNTVYFFAVKTNLYQTRHKTTIIVQWLCWAGLHHTVRIHTMASMAPCLRMTESSER